MPSRPKDPTLSGAPAEKKVFLAAGLIYALSLATRLVFLAQGVNDPTLRVPVVDESTNWEVARVILHGHLRPVPYVRAPGYLYVLAGLAGLSGEESFLARVMQVSLDALNPVLALLIARSVFGPLAGVVAGLLGATFWTCVCFSCQLVDTSLTCLLCLLLAYLLVRLPDDRFWKWLACGLLAGIAAIVRPNILAFVPLMASGMILHAGLRYVRRSAGRHAFSELVRALTEPLLRSALLISGCILGVAPVTLRNLIVAGDWVPVCVSGGANLWIANRPGADGLDPAPFFDADPTPLPGSAGGDPWENVMGYQLMVRHARKQLGPGFRHSEMDRLFTRMVFQEVRRRPVQLAVSFLKRLAWSFNAYEYPNNNDLYEFQRFSWLLRFLSHLHFGIVGPVALIGIVLVLTAPRYRVASVAGYLLLTMTLIATGAMFAISARYRLPTACLLLPFAGHGFAEIIRLLRHPLAQVRVSLGVLVSLLALGALCNANLFAFRPEHRPAYLDWLYARSCMGAGDNELIPDAMAVLGRRMVADAEASVGRESMSSLIRRYEHPFSFLMGYYTHTREWAEVVRYGEYMLKFEPYEESRTLEYLAVFVRRKNPGNPLLAHRALERIAPILRGRNPNRLGEIYVLFGWIYQDREALNNAVELFTSLSLNNPSELKYRRKLIEAQRTLASLTAMTRPSGSRPTTGAASVGREVRR